MKCNDKKVENFRLSKSIKQENLIKDIPELVIQLPEGDIINIRTPLAGMLAYCCEMTLIEFDK